VLWHCWGRPACTRNTSVPLFKRFFPEQVEEPEPEPAGRGWRGNGRCSRCWNSDAMVSTRLSVVLAVGHAAMQLLTDCYSSLYLSCSQFHSCISRNNVCCLQGKRENYQVCSVQYCVQQLCTVQCTHIWTDLAVVCWLDLAFLWLYCGLQFFCVRFSCLWLFLLLFCAIPYWCMCAFVLLWLPCVADADIIFLSCFFFFFMVALCNRADHYIFILFLLSSFFFLSFFSSPNLSGRRLDVYHTLAHGVALVRI